MQGRFGVWAGGSSVGVLGSLYFRAVASVTTNAEAVALGLHELVTLLDAQDEALLGSSEAPA